MIALQDQDISTLIVHNQEFRFKCFERFQFKAVVYKSRLAGVFTVAVDPRNTSRTCSECGHCEKGNRSDRDTFHCLHCDYSTNADQNAARNLRILGLRCCKPPSELAVVDSGWNPDEISRKAAGL
jgi:transposase